MSANGAAKVLLVEDDSAIAIVIAAALEDEGFAITRVDEESAQETLGLMKEMGVLEGELDAEVALKEEAAIASGDAS